MRSMVYLVKGQRVYFSTFDEATGNLVRLVDDLSDRDHHYQIEDEICKKFPHRYAMVPSPSPELLDIAITNKCSMGCSYCYRDSKPNSGHGRKDLVETILRGFETVPYQIALGGGEPTQHPDFPYILRKARELGTVPNYTTAGFRMTPEIIAATNEVCGGVAMTYHSFKGFDWFKEHYKKLRDQLKVKLNIHLIADKDVAKNLRDLVKARDELGPLSVILLAYYPDVGRGNLDGLMTRTTYTRDLPEAITYARATSVDIAFSEGLLPYFLSRPELGVNTSFAMRSEGVFSGYFDQTGRMSTSSFDPPDERCKTAFNEPSQKLWEELYSGQNEPDGEPCYACKFRKRCSSPSNYHYLVCKFAPQNRLPLMTAEVERKTRFQLLQEDD